MHILRTLRETAGLTQRQLAARIGITPTAISKLEHGTRHMRIAELPSFAAALGCSMAQLLVSDAAPPAAVPPRVAPSTLLHLASSRSGGQAGAPPGQETLVPVPLALPAEQLELIDAVSRLALKVGANVTSREGVIILLIDMGVAALLSEMGVPPAESPPVKRRGPATVTPLRRRETAGP